MPSITDKVALFLFSQASRCWFEFHFGLFSTFGQDGSHFSYFQHIGEATRQRFQASPSARTAGNKF